MKSNAVPPPQDLIESVLRRASGDGAVVIVHPTTESNVRFAANKLTTSGETSSTSITVVSIKGGAYGTCRGDVASLDQAYEILGRAEEIASNAKQAPDAFKLVDAEEASFLSEGFETALRDEEQDGFFDFVTPGIDGIFTKAKKENLLTFGFASFAKETVLLGTSTGVRAGYSETRAHLGMTTKSDDYSRSVWSGQTSHTLADIDIEAAFAEGRALLDASSVRKNIEPGKYTCVLSPSCVADMLLWMYWMMSLRDADEGKTVFSNRKAGGSRIGEQIYPESVSLWSDPSAERLECLPFVVTGASHSLESVFDNGYPLSKTSWIDKGIQTSLVTTRHYASQKGLRPAPMIPNLLLSISGASASSEVIENSPGGIRWELAQAQPLIAGVERGLYVNCLWYIRLVDPQTALLTGLTRDGVFLIENGKIVAEVNNFRFNQSPVEMLASVKGAGAPVLATPREFDDVGIWVSAPPLVVENFNMSTVSEAQ